METLSPSEARRKTIELLRSGKRGEAEALARQLLKIDSKDHTALHCLGLIAESTGHPQDAVDLIERAIAAEPALSEYHYNLAVSLTAIGKTAVAIDALRKAVRLEPGFQLAQANLGGLLLAEGKVDDAEPVLRKAVALNPREPSARANLGKLMLLCDQLDEAEAEFRAAISLATSKPQPWNLLGDCLREMGRIGEATGAFRNAINLRPGYREAFSNLCFSLHLDPRATPEQILTEHREWGRRFADPHREQIKRHDNDRSPERRLRIGYVSPDFRADGQALFMIPLFENHDRENFQTYCYSSTSKPDETTEPIRASVEQWRDISKLTDEQAADLVRIDKIDLLVDLTLHMPGNRLVMFARKPAPVQMTWLGYPSTTGVATIDYRISDPHLDPPESSETFYIEKTLRLPNSFWCYRPPEGTPEVNALPARANGCVTFVSFNGFTYVNDVTLELWVKVLSRVGGSRLILLAPEGSSRKRVTDFFNAAGVEPDRVTFVDRVPQREYMEKYHHVDILLDTIPFSGSTTTLDALYMGIPAVTLKGATAVSRGGESILRNLGLEEFVAGNAEEYVAVAEHFAGDLSRLEDLRQSLRGLMRSSPIMDEKAFARDMESLYRDAWRRWCERK